MYLKKIICIAHNGQAFDHQFMLNHILTKTDLKPSLIMTGSKIVSMTLCNINVLDSLKYFPMPLSAQLWFGAEMKKGYFPHLFNTLDNQSYYGLLREFYAPKKMKGSNDESVNAKRNRRILPKWCENFNRGVLKVSSKFHRGMWRLSLHGSRNNNNQLAI